MNSDFIRSQTTDCRGFDLVMGDNLHAPSVLLADRGYGADHIRKAVEAGEALPMISMRKSRKMRVGVDWSLYRLRNLVKRCFNKLTTACRVATRYDKITESFLGGHRHHVNPTLAPPFVNMT